MPQIVNISNATIKIEENIILNNVNFNLESNQMKFLRKLEVENLHL